MGILWAVLLVDNYNDGAAEKNERLGEVVVQPQDHVLWGILGGLIGAVVSVGVILALRFVTQDLFEKIAPAVLCIILGMVVGYGLVRYITHFFRPQDANITLFLYTSVILIFGFIGISLGLTMASNWEALKKAMHRRQFAVGQAKVVDTSVIIDGRISDICKTGFVEGPLLIPRFVLKELQNIADSPDVLRRARGRRGLDIIKEMQENNHLVEIQVVEDDPEEIQEVDGKLVRVARDYGGKILTNDLNLNKVAQIEGVQVLNINDLANALKPAVLPDEQMQVRIVKEGKEAFQGVGYLDDGTMIVVDGGKDHVGKDVSVVVTSVLQTTAGRMIFTKLQSVLS
jgi:uncharacterized protein YacL